MAVIYMVNPEGGAKVACSEAEAQYDEGLGWRRFDPDVREDDLKDLRAAYREKFGKKPFAGWDADTLLEKMAE